ncbi:unnamed protein product [Debaryomyces tyrocola]|nr:unnamed protein product [Debaryomyces tyrocola]
MLVDFFQSQVGGVQNIALSYNEKGQFKGIATIIFKSSKSASKAVEKYNGAPIDGGSSKLKLELIVDPTKKPLTSRIAPNKVTGPKAAGPKVANPKLAAAKAAAKANLKSKKDKPAQAKKPAKRSKKTVEQLDQEMADYFDN